MPVAATDQVFARAGFPAIDPGAQAGMPLGLYLACELLSSIPLMKRDDAAVKWSFDYAEKLVAEYNARYP